jgi:multiple sugar transport system substrate-binding protein
LTNVVRFSALKIRQTLLVLLSLCLSFSAYSITVIDFATSILDAKEKESYEAIITSFEADNTDIKVRMRIIEGQGFSRLNDSLFLSLKASPNHIDLLAWYGGKRIAKLAQQGLLQPLDNFWQRHQLDDDFSDASKANVSYNKHIYAIPVSYYPWGFFYSKRVFARLNITPPNTWQELLDILVILKNSQFTPIAIGTKEPWPAAGWFDYLILRNNPFSFYRELMQGKISYNSPQVIEALTLWQLLIDKKYFSRHPQEFDGENLLPLISREVAGLQLIGSFALHNVADKFKSEFGYFSFPQMKKTKNNLHEVNEIAPLSTVSLLKSSQHKEQALRFLRYLAQPETQYLLNKPKNTLSPNLKAQESHSELVRRGKRQLEQADHLTQYFDRETDEKMATFAKQAFANFIEHGDIKRLVMQLEKQRKKVFAQQ